MLSTAQERDNLTVWHDSMENCWTRTERSRFTTARITNTFWTLPSRFRESKLREQSWIKFGCNGFERQRPLSQPLAFWLEEDILRYLKMTGIPYAPIYGDIVESRKKNGTPILKTTGVSRSGCMYCMYGVHLEHEPNRFQLMQVTHPQQYDYCINKLGCGAVLDYIGVPYRNQQLEVDHC